MNDNRFRSRKAVIAYVALGLAFFVVVFLLKPASHTYSISPETTYITEPLTPDGRVDYVKALNERLRGDITPDRNAVVLIWQAIGPRPLERPYPPEYFEWLGVPEPAEDGNYLINFRTILQPIDRTENEVECLIKENANSHLEKMFEWTRKSPWKAKDQPEIAAWIHRNQRPLELLTQASKRPDYFNPVIPDDTETTSIFAPPSGTIWSAKFSSVSDCRRGIDILLSRSMLRLGEGLFAESWEDLMTCHRLGRLIAKGSAIFEIEMGWGIQQVAMRTERVFLQHAPLTRETLARYRDDLKTLSPEFRIAKAFDYSVRFGTLDFVQHASRHGIQSFELPAASEEVWLPTSIYTERSTDWGPCMESVNSWVDRHLAILRIQEHQERLEHLDTIYAEYDNLHTETKNQAWQIMFFSGKNRGRLLGKITTDLFMPIVENRIIFETQMHQAYDINNVVFALAAHRLEHSRYPRTLHELSPKYLELIPNDILSNAPFQYHPSKDGYDLIYSSGKHRKHPGRGCVSSQPTDYTRTISMPLSEPEKPVPEPIEP